MQHLDPAVCQLQNTTKVGFLIYFFMSSQYYSPVRFLFVSIAETMVLDIHTRWIVQIDQCTGALFIISMSNSKIAIIRSQFNEFKRSSKIKKERKRQRY
jgi:hypothetical protein